MIKKTYSLISNEKGDAYISEAVRIIIAVVLGGILIAGLVSLASNVVLPGLQESISNTFSKA